MGTLSGLRPFSGPILSLLSSYHGVSGFICHTLPPDLCAITDLEGKVPHNHDEKPPCSTPNKSCFPPSC